jgi:hypothetical protein
MEGQMVKRPTADAILIKRLAAEAKGPLPKRADLAAEVAASDEVLLEAAEAVASSAIAMVRELTIASAEKSATAVAKAENALSPADLRELALDAASDEIRIVNPQLDNARVRDIAMMVASAVVALGEDRALALRH